MNKTEYVILVDEEDKITGKEEKLEAHRKALLHRAFSVFLYRIRNHQVEILLQQREKNKYHCGGLWANTCCSHPREGEDIIEAGKRRLKEEVGIDYSNQLLTDVGWFQYKAEFSNGLTEHEVDHVLVGLYDENIEHIPFNPLEVESLRWMSIDDILRDLKENPTHYTPWFPLALNLAREKKFDGLNAEKKQD